MKAELQCVLSSRTFRQSRGLAKLLRYICGKALLEDSEQVTEYTIAVDVLGKPTDFKESKDASVRVEAHRLRKKLAEFYEQEGAERRIRIVIPTGQYTPQFVVKDDPRAVQPVGAEPAAPAIDIARSSPRPRLRLVPVLGVVAALVAVGGVALFFATRNQPDPLDDFWHPVFSTANPILICVGNLEGGLRTDPGGTISPTLTMNDYHNMASEMMLVSDGVTLSRLAGLLQSKGKRFRVVSQSEATFADLQSSPAVLVGLLNNDWTGRLLGKLRFSAERQTENRVIIRDRDNPKREDWSMNYTMPYLSVTRDYALVVRVLDPKTEQMVVTAAGISVFGTLAAGEFLTNPQEFRKIEAVAPKDWRGKNFQLVLSTDVIRGKCGHPSIVASYFW